jgi:hypothetical protein
MAGRGCGAAGLMLTQQRSPGCAQRDLWNVEMPPCYSLMLAASITFAHLSLKSTTNSPNSVGELANTVVPWSAICALIFASASAALISLLSMAMIHAGVVFGAPIPTHPLASYPAQSRPREGRQAIFRGGLQRSRRAGTAFPP